MTTFVPSPTQSQIFTALRAFLLTILPAGVSVLRGQANRVAEPVGADFVIMTPLRQVRLETNIDNYLDTLFTASITAAVMTVTSVQFGVIAVGNQIYGVGLVSGTTTITGFLSGSLGGIGTYSVSQSQNVASGLLACGAETFLQPSEIVIQCDVHGPNSQDNSQTITTLFRDDFGVQQFLTSGFDIGPLYADDPRQVAFINDQNAFEDRWIIEAHLQANIVVSAGQQFASALNLGLIEVP